MATARQKAWQRAAHDAGDSVAAGLFTLIAQPNEQERGHDCRVHAVGFSRGGRRGLKCGVCSAVLRWLDGER